MDIATGLDRALKRAEIPIIGVTIRNPADRATWSIDYAPEATPDQQAAAAAILADYNPDTDTEFLDEKTLERLSHDDTRVFVLLLAELTGRTPDFLRDRMVAISRSLNT